MTLRLGFVAASVARELGVQPERAAALERALWRVRHAALLEAAELVCGPGYSALRQLIRWAAAAREPVDPDCGAL